MEAWGPLICEAHANSEFGVGGRKNVFLVQEYVEIHANTFFCNTTFVLRNPIGHTSSWQTFSRALRISVLVSSGSQEWWGGAYREIWILSKSSAKIDVVGYPNPVARGRKS